MKILIRNKYLIAVVFLSIVFAARLYLDHRNSKEELKPVYLKNNKGTCYLIAPFQGALSSKVIEIDCKVME